MVTTALHALPGPVDNLLDYMELLRSRAARQLNDERRAARGQYFTPAQVAQLMTMTFT
jgi:type I restriction-modification system DNA methylase subunit